MPFPSPSHLEFFGSALDVVMREFRDLYAQLAGWLSKEHKGDGTHAHVTAYDVTVDEFVGFAQTGAFLSAGTGSPEDVVTAPPGSLWLEDDGGGGAVVWHKQTGTSDMGWVALGTGTGGGAPVDAQYVTLASDPTLSQERVLTAGTGIAITDGGANGPVTITATVAGGAPVSGSFVTMSTDATLTSERVLTGTPNQVIVTDGGAGNTVTLSTPQDIATTSVVQFGRMGLNGTADPTAKLKIAGQYGATTVDAGTSGTTKTIDWDQSNTQTLTLTGNCTIAMINPKDGFRYLLFVAQDATGSRAVTWPGSVQWTVGAAPVLTTTPGAIDVVTLVWLADISTYIAAANIAGGSLAPKTATFVTLSTDSTLTNERVLTGTANQVLVTDGGAGTTVTLSTPQDLALASTPQFGRMGLGVAADASATLKIAGQYGSPLYDAGTSGAAKTITWDNGNTQFLTLTGNCTLTLSTPKDGFRYLLFVKQDGTGGWSLTWPASVIWPGGVTLLMTTTPGLVDLVTLVWIAGLGASGNYIANGNVAFTPV